MFAYLLANMIILLTEAAGGRLKIAGCRLLQQQQQQQPRRRRRLTGITDSAGCACERINVLIADVYDKIVAVSFVV